MNIPPVSGPSDAAHLPQIAFGPRVRTSPFFAATRRWGCKAWTIYNHMYMPLWYDSPEGDYWKLVNDVTLWDVASERQVEITGPDASRFIQYLTPRNLEKTRPGQCRYILLTAPDGGIVNDPVLLKLADQHYWLSAADADILLWAKGVAVRGEFDVEIVEPDVSPLQLQGPRADAVAADLFGDWVHDLKYFHFRETELDGIPLVLSRTGWSGERGFEIFLRDGARGDSLWERCMEAGRPHGIAPAAPSVARRIEGALLSYGADMTLEETPFDIGLDRLVDLRMTADHIGREALRRIAERGVHRRLFGVHLLAPALPAPNEAPWPAFQDGARIGRVTSAVYSPRLQRNIALALIRPEHVPPRETFDVETPYGVIPARIVDIPFIAPLASKPPEPAGT